MDIEAGLIGYLITHEEDIENAALSVTPEMFDDPMLKSIYTEMLKGKKSVLAISEALSIPNFDEVVRNCISACIVGEPLKSYVIAIRRHDRERKAHSILDRFKGDINASDIDIQLDQLSDAIEEIKAKKKSKGATTKDLAKYKGEYFKPHGVRFKFGFQSVDEACGGVDKGDMCVIAARPAVGKTAFALNVIWHNPDLKCGYFNLEMTEQQIYERWVCADSGIDIGHLRKADHANNDELQRLEEATKRMEENNNILFYTGSVTVKTIYEQCKRESFDYIIVDYLQLIKPDSGRGSNRTAEVGDISRGLKEIATRFQIPVIALSQLNRASEGTKDKEPTMAEIRESGAIEQDASIIIILWRGEENGKRNIKVEKARMGIPGKSELNFDGAHMRFSEAPVYASGEVPFD